MHLIEDVHMQAGFKNGKNDVAYALSSSLARSRSRARSLSLSTRKGTGAKSKLKDLQPEKRRVYFLY